MWPSAGCVGCRRGTVAHAVDLTGRASVIDGDTIEIRGHAISSETLRYCSVHLVDLGIAHSHTCPGEPEEEGQLAIPPGDNSSAARAHEDTSVPFDVVPSNLLTDPLTGLEQERRNHGAGGASVVASATARLRAAILPAFKSTNSLAEVQPRSAMSRGPRLERVPTLAIQPAATLPRQRLESSDFAALTASIKKNGLAQPLLVGVNPAQPEMFELFAGYRRWRAALAAKVDYVPAVVFEHLNEAVTLELNLLENSNRRDLTIIEEAQAFQVLVERYGRTADQIAELTGRSRNQVTNMLCLVALPEEVRLRLRAGQIGFEHARVLVGVTDAASLARRIVEERLTVRETELLAAQLRSTAPSIEGNSTEPDGSSDSTGSVSDGPESVIAPADIRLLTDLSVLQAALRDAIGSEFKVRTDRDGSVLVIEGRSTQDSGNVASVLREAMRWLRLNRTIPRRHADL